MVKYFKFTLYLMIATSSQLFAVSNTEKNSLLASELMQKFVKDSSTPGLAVSVGLAGKIIWSKGFGYADLEQKVPVDPALTKFRVGSIAKPFTAFALAKLIDEKKIDLDAEIQRYVPSFPQKKHPITVRQVAGHLAGIRHYADGEFYNNKKYNTVLEGLTIFQDDPLEYVPGEKWSYTSYGYNLLSAVVEAAAEKPFLNYMSDEVFLPLGMSQTVPDHINEIVLNRGRYYRRSNNQFFNEPEVDNSYKWAGGGFLSTSDDLVRFGFAHLGNQYLTQSTIDLLWTSQKSTAGEVTGYGIGWRIAPVEGGQTWLGHGGGSVGGSTQFWLLEKHGLVIVMISNLSELDYSDVLIKLSKIFMDRKY